MSYTDPNPPNPNSNILPSAVLQGRGRPHVGSQHMLLALPLPNYILGEIILYDETLAWVLYYGRCVGICYSIPHPQSNVCNYFVNVEKGLY